MPAGTTGGNMTYAQMQQFAAFLPKELYLPATLWPVGSDPSRNWRSIPPSRQSRRNFSRLSPRPG